MKVETVELGQTGIDCVKIGLLHVRAADNIRVLYDFARDGYVILQASRYAWKANDNERNADWQEVAFIEAWARADNQYHKSVTGQDV
jgi:hypothetical protein